MSKQTKNAPVATHRDGAISAKVWRNVSNEGKPYYSTTFARTYTNPQTQQIAEAQSFGGTDILKVQQLAGEAYQSITQLREQDKQRNQEKAPEQSAQAPTPEELREINNPLLPTQDEAQGLEAQRDSAMAEAEPDRPGQGYPEQSPAYER